MKPVLYRYRDSESVIKAMDGYTPGEGWEPLYDQAAMDDAVAAERERCAKMCEAIQPTPAWHDAPEVADLKAQRNELLALLIYASSEIKSEYPESQWSEYRVFEMETAIAKYAAVRTKEVEVPDDLA